MTVKLASRVIPNVLMGYSDTQKGYRLYNMLSHVFFVAHDVKFLEHVFPFETKVGLLPLFCEQHLDDDPSHNYNVSSHSEGDVDVPKDDEIPYESDNNDHVKPTQTDQYLLRRSRRVVRPPIWHKDYQMTQSSTNHPITNVVLY